MKKQTRSKPLAFGIAIILTLVFSLASGIPAGSQAWQEVTPTPALQLSVDRLAVPVLPEHPSQVETGRVVYYYHCMPCHGDQGQGLTEEWRQVWVDDHRNCWDRGCHGGRVGDEGFPLARVIPAVAGPGALDRFASPEELFAYLQATHPPQYPGKLAEEDYWASAAYILSLNGLQDNESSIGPHGSGQKPGLGIQLVLLFALILVLWGALVRQASLYRYDR